MNRQDKEDIKMPYSMRLKSHKQDAGKRKPRIVTVKPISEPMRNETKPADRMEAKVEALHVKTVTSEPIESTDSSMSSTNSPLTPTNSPLSQTDSSLIQTNSPLSPTTLKPPKDSIPTTRISPQSVKTPSPLFIQYSRSTKLGTEVIARTTRLMKRSWCCFLFLRSSSLM